MVLTLANYPERETLIPLPDGCTSISRVALGGIVLTKRQAEVAKLQAEVAQKKAALAQKKAALVIAQKKAALAQRLHRRMQ